MPLNEAHAKLLTEVRDNFKRLDACPLHEFGPPDKPLCGSCVCRRCGGRLEYRLVRWYNRGLEHGK